MATRVFRSYRRAQARAFMHPLKATNEKTCTVLLVAEYNKKYEHSTVLYSIYSSIFSCGTSIPERCDWR